MDVLGHLQTSYESMCDLISNILHNLTHYQRHATQCDKVNMLILYVSYQHALKSFEVELFTWEMEVALMCIEVSQNTILQWENQKVQWFEKMSWDWNLI